MPIGRTPYHDLKTINPHFENVWNGIKTAEIRLMDRDFQVGDLLILREVLEPGEATPYAPASDDWWYSGRYLIVRITHILVNEAWLQPEYGMLSFVTVTSGAPQLPPATLRRKD